MKRRAGSVGCPMDCGVRKIVRMPPTFAPAAVVSRIVHSVAPGGHIRIRTNPVRYRPKAGPADREGARRRTPPEVTRSLMATEAAAIVLAEEHQLPASRLGGGPGR
jgi:hypothetical protein